MKRGTALAIFAILVILVMAVMALAGIDSGWAARSGGDVGCWCPLCPWLCDGGGGTPPEPPTPTPEPTPQTPCEYEPYTVSYDPVAYMYYYPPHPIVAGQDPEKRGVDLVFVAQSFPIEYWYKDLVCVEEGCCHNEQCEGDNPPDDCGTRGCEWNETPCCIRSECRWFTRYYPDTIEDVRISLSLSPGSRSYIERVLARKYPGARVKGNYPMQPVSSVDGLHTHLATGRALRVQLQDPGTYEVNVCVDVSGWPDIGVGPRTKCYRYDLEVSFFESAVTR